MLADILGAWGAIATIVSAAILIGGILLTQVRRARGRGRTRTAIDEVVVGVPEVVDERTGRVIQPERPGLIDRMDDMDDWRGSVDERLDQILDKVTPNGGNTDKPADVLLNLQTSVSKIADHIGLDLETP